MAERTDVAIIGGGITGLALAWELRRVGLSAVVVERSYTGAGGSGRNVGRIRAMQLTPELARFALAAQRKHERLPQELGANTLFWRAGYAWALYEPEELDRMARLLPMLRELRIPARLLESSAAARRLDILAGGEPLAGAMLGRDAIVHHDAVMYAYRRACLRAAIPVLEGRTVAGIITRRGRVDGVALERGEIEAPTVVNAAGGWARDISTLAGLPVPNLPLRREVLVTEAARPFMAPAITFYRPQEGWFNQTLRGELVAGVTDPGEEAGLRHDTSLGFLRRTATVLLRKAPRLGHLRVIRQWAGVYDMTPDRKPLVGPVRRLPGFVQANGYSGRGFAQAPLVAELLARWLATGRRPELLAAFDPDRFEGREKPTTITTDYYEAYRARAESRED